MHGVSTCSFQVGDISNLERELKIDQMQATEKQNLGMFSQSELDLFMVIILIHTLSCMAWFTQTSMNEWMFLYLWDMMGQVLNQSNITHHNFSSCWWTLHGYLKHVLPAWKRLHSEMRIVFCSNSMTVTLFPICLCVCASVQIVSFHIYFRPQRLLEEGYYSAYKCHNQISIYITSWNFSHQNMSYRFTSWNFPTFFL